MIKYFLSLMLILSLVACANIPQEPAYTYTGTIISTRQYMTIENEPNGTGALIGGILGGVTGNQFGKGNGKTALTVLGVVAGAAVGSQMNQTQKTIFLNELVIKKPDDNMVTITVQATGFVQGQRVLVTQRGNQVEVQAFQQLQKK
jgi:outer membrane lipoprotein SlyB